MDRGNQIEHKGVVTAIGKGTAKVRLLDADGECRGCAIAGLCRKPVEVEARIGRSSGVGVGDRVVLTARASTQRRALILLAGVPLLLLVAVLAAASALGAGELAAGLAALGAVALWYAILYMMRVRINRTIQFKVRDIRL